MKRSLFIIAAVVLLLGQTVFGQKPPAGKTPRTPTPSGAQTAAYPSLGTQAAQLAAATVSGDFAKVADFTYPKVVEGFGGKEKMVRVLKSDSAQMKAEGFELVAMSVGEIKQVAKIENEIFAVVPVKITINSPDGKEAGESSMVAVSTDNGANWTFINGINQERFQAAFPKAAEKLRIPVEKPPQPIENE